MDIDTTSKRKRGTDASPTEVEKEEARAKRLRVAEGKEILRSIGVTRENRELLGRPLDDLSDEEKDRLKGLRVDLWLACGACEIRIAVAEFWLSNRPPIYITETADHVVPDWVCRDKRWYVLWWQNSPFTVPGETGFLGPTSTLTAERPNAEHWIRNVWQPGRTGRPRCVIYEILISWHMDWNQPGMFHSNLENCYNLFWLFSLLEGRFERLAIKIRFKDSMMLPNQVDEAAKRDIPAAAWQVETAIFDLVNRALKLQKRFINGQDGYGYARFMDPTRAHNPAISTATKDMDVKLRLSYGLRDAINRLMESPRCQGFAKIHMVLAFFKGEIAPRDVVRLVRADNDVRAYLRILPGVTEDQKEHLRHDEDCELDTGVCTAEPPFRMFPSPPPSPLFNP